MAPSTPDRTEPQPCNSNKLSGQQSTFKHWHYCRLPAGHDGPHVCMSCKVEFNR